MRTSTKFIKGKDFNEFGKIIKNFFPAGKLLVIAQNKDEGEKLIRLLGADYNSFLTSPNEKFENFNARFVIGIGGSGVISATKRAVKDNKFAFIPTVFDYRFLCDFDGSSALPEFVFLSEKALSEEKDFCIRLYSNIFQLYSECIFRLFYTSAFPYRDKIMEAYCKVAESILSGEKEQEEYVSEGLRFVTNVVNELFARKTRSLLSEKVAKNYGVTSGERFCSSYFLLLMLKNFTKHHFRDILLPSEKTVIGVKSVKREAFDGKLLPSNEKLNSYYAKISFLTEMPEPNLPMLINALSVSVDDSNPVFAIINNEGITDALGNEKFERNFGVLV